MLSAVVDISFPEIEKFDRLKAPTATAFVSVMEGCMSLYTRGEEVSRPVDDVIAEVVAEPRDQPAWAKRERLSRAIWARLRLCRTDHAGQHGSGHRAHPVHHVSPRGIQR